MVEPNPFEIEGVNRGKKQKATFPLLTGVLFFGCLFLGGLMLTPFPEKVRRKLGFSKAPDPVVKIVKEKGEVIEKVTIQEVYRDSKPNYYTPKKGISVAKTSAGFDYKSEVVELEGELASRERVTPGAYEALYRLSVKRPRAAVSLSELESVTPKLGEMLPGLEAMLANAKVSPFFDALYENKAKRLKSRADRLDRLLTKHNYYDCQTMLEMVAAESQRKVFLMQGDMDVVTDGSDGDRLAVMPDEIVNSTYYQPWTSYSWPKVGTVENPLVKGWRTRLAEATSASEISRLKKGIEEMGRRSYLIAEHDPFIVIPVYVIKDRESAWGPNIGDYVAVIYEGKIYPAIVGDGGPSFKVGEASLRMARTINEKASSIHRPVSSVGVTYVIFPRTSVKKWVAPDYEMWKSETERLLGEMGGLGEGYEFYEWKNTLPVQ